MFWPSPLRWHFRALEHCDFHHDRQCQDPQWWEKQPPRMVERIWFSLPETSIASENGWLKIRSFPLGRLGLVSGAFAVSFREAITVGMEQSPVCEHKWIFMRFFCFSWYFFRASFWRHTVSNTGKSSEWNAKRGEFPLRFTNWAIISCSRIMVINLMIHGDSCINPSFGNGDVGILQCKRKCWEL